MENGTTAGGEIRNPNALALDYLLNRNRWLVRIRWIYSLFIILYFQSFRLLGHSSLAAVHEEWLVFLLPLLGNVVFFFDLKRRAAAAEIPYQYFQGLSNYVTLQLDFDLIVLSLFVFFSGGLASPAVALFIFHVLVSTFLIETRKALRNVLMAILLMTVIFLVQHRNLVITSVDWATLATLAVLLIFAFTISGYLARNLRRNETVMQDLFKKTHELSITDGLTGLFNQTHFLQLLDVETKKSERYHLVYSLIMFDVDDFKNYNDSNGHIHGSLTLQQIGAMMKRIFRSSDVLAKYGGDEFIILLPQTDKVGAYLAAERLRESVEKEYFAGQESQPGGNLTISLGIASYPEHGLYGGEVLDRADRAMYVIKDGGKNGTAIFNESVEAARTDHA